MIRTSDFSRLRFSRIYVDGISSTSEWSGWHAHFRMGACLQCIVFICTGKDLIREHQKFELSPLEGEMIWPKLNTH